MRRLYDAIQDGSTSRVLAILEAAPEAIEAVGEGNANRRGKTPLMWALQCHRLGLAAVLVERGADVRARMSADPHWSVLSLAVRCVIAGRGLGPHLQIIEVLIDAGADPNDGLWPAVHAYRKAFDQPEMIELLLQRGADPDRPFDDTGSTARELVRNNARLYGTRVLALFGLDE